MVFRLVGLIRLRIKQVSRIGFQQFKIIGFLRPAVKEITGIWIQNCNRISNFSVYPLQCSINRILADCRLISVNRIPRNSYILLYFPACQHIHFVGQRFSKFGQRGKLFRYFRDDHSQFFQLPVFIASQCNAVAILKFNRQPYVTGIS